MNRLRFWGMALTIGWLAGGWPLLPGLALPPTDEVPEEVLRTRIVTAARSPIDGKPLSAAEYAQLQEQLRDVNDVGTVDPELAQLIFLLQLRRVFRPVLPFIP